MVFVRAVRKIEARDVHTVFQHLLKDILAKARGAECTNDFCLSHKKITSPFLPFQFTTILFQKYVRMIFFAKKGDSSLEPSPFLKNFQPIWTGLFTFIFLRIDYKSGYSCHCKNCN